MKNSSSQYEQQRTDLAAFLALDTSSACVRSEPSLEVWYSRAEPSATTGRRTHYAMYVGVQNNRSFCRIYLVLGVGMPKPSWYCYFPTDRDPNWIRRNFPSYVMEQML